MFCGMLRYELTNLRCYKLEVCHSSENEPLRSLYVDWARGYLFSSFRKGRWARLATPKCHWQITMENTVKCYIALFLLITSFIGSPMVYYGSSCKNAELRAENKNGTCKDIHNDESAAALLWIGVIFVAPLQIVVGIVSLYVLCICLTLFCAWDDVLPA